LFIICASWARKSPKWMEVKHTNHVVVCARFPFFGARAGLRNGEASKLFIPTYLAQNKKTVSPTPLFLSCNGRGVIDKDRRRGHAAVTRLRQRSRVVQVTGCEDHHHGIGKKPSTAMLYALKHLVTLKILVYHF